MNILEVVSSRLMAVGVIAGNDTVNIHMMKTELPLTLVKKTLGQPSLAYLGSLLALTNGAGRSISDHLGIVLILGNNTR